MRVCKEATEWFGCGVELEAPEVGDLVRVEVGDGVRTLPEFFVIDRTEAGLRAQVIDIAKRASLERDVCYPLARVVLTSRGIPTEHDGWRVALMAAAVVGSRGAKVMRKSNGAFG